MTRKPGRPRLPEEEKAVQIRLSRRTVAILDANTMRDLESHSRDVLSTLTENELRHFIASLRRRAIDELVERHERNRHRTKVEVFAPLPEDVTVEEKAEFDAWDERLGRFMARTLPSGVKRAIAANRRRRHNGGESD